MSRIDTSSDVQQKIKLRFIYLIKTIDTTQLVPIGIKILLTRISLNFFLMFRYLF
jgi:hypothetical protein